MCHDESKSQNKICEYIIIYQDELYSPSSTLQEILHIRQDKYKSRLFHMFIKDLIFHMIQEEQ